MAGVRGVESASKVGSSAKKCKNELRLYKKIPVWICEYHQEVLPYIYRAIGSKYLPFFGITLLHFDSHPDLMAPLDMKAESVYNKGILFDVVSIADWILPAVYVGHIKKVIWIKPPWSEQISDKTLCFNVGSHKVKRTIRVSCSEKYFCEDGLYVPHEELENCRELTVVVKTMPVNNSCNTLSGNDVDVSYPGGGKQQNNASKNSSTGCCSDKVKDEQKFDFQQGGNLCNSCNCDCKQLNIASKCACLDRTQFENDEAVKSSKSYPQGENLCSSNSYCENLIVTDECACSDKRKFESDIQLFINEVLSQLEEPYILDIDMDFFSTLNPFKTMFSKEEFEALKIYYEFPQVDSHEESNIMDASQRHKENVQRLKRTLNFLNESEGDNSDTEKQPPSVDLGFMEFIKKWRDSRHELIDYEMVHSAGMTTTLPVHITDERDIVIMIKTLEQLLLLLPKPTIITIARSSVDDYTPPTSVEFIQSCLITCLENCYKENIELFPKYKDE